MEIEQIFVFFFTDALTAGGFASRCRSVGEIANPGRLGRNTTREREAHPMGNREERGRDPRKR